MERPLQTIGFVGLGHVGGNMAARLLPAGYPVHGEERHREHARNLEEQGLAWHDTPREVAEASDVVFTSLPDDAALERAAAGPDGILAGLAAGKTWVDVSTVSPRVSRELAAQVREHGAAMLDAARARDCERVGRLAAVGSGRRRRALPRGGARLREPRPRGAVPGARAIVTAG